MTDTEDLEPLLAIDDLYIVTPPSGEDFIEVGRPISHPRVGIKLVRGYRKLPYWDLEEL